MWPIDDITELLQTTVTAYLKGDGSPLRELFFQRLNAVQHLKVFHLVVAAFNITPDEVSQIFAKCESLELMKYLATNYEISKEDAVRDLYGALRRESLVDASWLADQFQLTKQDLFPGVTVYGIMQCRHLDLVKWALEKFQITADDLGTSFLWYTTCSGNTELVRWVASTYKFERDGVVRAFLGACDKGNIEIVKFLIEFYQLTTAEIQRENLALKNCDDKFLREWLLDNYYTVN